MIHLKVKKLPKCIPDKLGFNWMDSKRNPQKGNVIARQICYLPLLPYCKICFS